MTEYSPVQTPSDLNTLDRKQLAAFLTGDNPERVSLWNAWREETERPLIDLSNANLRNAELHGIDLRWMILRGVDLFDADLPRAQFYETDLRDAKLDGANLDEASLRKCTLDYANLETASLRRTDLYEASLIETNLQEADLRGARLVRAKLARADLRWANLARANLRWANLRDVGLSNVASLEGVLLYEASFMGILSVRYEQFLGKNRRTRGWQRHYLRLFNRLYESSIWEEHQGRFLEATDVFAGLKGFFEDAGDYQAANWAYTREKVMRKMWRVPKAFRWLYPRWRGLDDFRYNPDLFEWLKLEFSEKIANYGNSIIRPALWLLAAIFLFAVLYWSGGMLTVTPGCSYLDRNIEHIAGCMPTHEFADALLFSLASMSTIEISAVQPFIPNIGLLTSLEALIGITLTGLLGFVLGNKLRYS